MEASYDGDVVRAGNQARERFYDSRGYGRPVDGTLELDPVEAAHLLFRGDLDAVRDGRPDGDGERLDFRAFLASTAVSEVAFLVYKNLRDRGFYLSPAREGWVERPDETTGDTRGDFVVYPRGEGPWDDSVAYRVAAVSERADVPADRLLALAGSDAEGTGVLAVVDEESELTYLELARPTVSGSTFHDIPDSTGDLLADRVLVAGAPGALHEKAFYGQPLGDGDDSVQLSLVEAAYLAGTGDLAVDGGQAAVVDRGRDVEGDRFDRRLRVYSALRTAGLVPKTGFKFGADFRTYADVERVDDLGHSERLIRVLPADHVFEPRDVALDVRLAHGVRKQMVVALTDPEAGIDWLAVERLTP
ncbi:tRNA-intron lyase [Halobacteriales archaeon Cl-PHB]